MMNVVNHNVNIVALEKNGRNYGMCCAWATQVDDDKVLCAIGSQSSTGDVIRKGDILGFSNLNKNQIDVALRLGNLEQHSADTDKLAGLNFRKDETAIIIAGARTENKCKVLEVLKIQELDEEKLVLLQVLDCKENPSESLLMSDIKF